MSYFIIIYLTIRLMKFTWTFLILSPYLGRTMFVLAFVKKLT